MSTENWSAIIMAIAALVTAIGGLVAVLRNNAAQNKVLATAAVKSDDHGAQLTEIAKAVNAPVVPPSNPPGGSDAKT
jgi:uncharacterized membrane protein